MVLSLRNFFLFSGILTGIHVLSSREHFSVFEWVSLQKISILCRLTANNWPGIDLRWVLLHGASAQQCREWVGTPLEFSDKEWFCDAWWSVGPVGSPLFWAACYFEQLLFLQKNYHLKICFSPPNVLHFHFFWHFCMFLAILSIYFSADGHLWKQCCQEPNNAAGSIFHTELWTQSGMILVSDFLLTCPIIPGIRSTVWAKQCQDLLQTFWQNWSFVWINISTLTFESGLHFSGSSLTLPKVPLPLDQFVTPHRNLFLPVLLSKSRPCTGAVCCLPMLVRCSKTSTKANISHQYQSKSDVWNMNWIAPAFPWAPWSLQRWEVISGTERFSVLKMITGAHIKNSCLRRM